MPDTTPEELDEQLLDLIDLQENTDAGDVMQQIAPALAAIRRHAAAQALREAAATVRRGAAKDREKARNADHVASGLYAAYVVKGTGIADRLRRAADDVIAEGYEHTCQQSTPATRLDPAEGCEALVENEGDYCPRHTDDRDPDRGEL